MPKRWVIGLTGEALGRHRAEDCHAVVSRWLDAHHHAQHKDWSLSPMRATATGAALDITTLTTDCASRLHAHVTPGRALRLDQALCHITTDPVPVEEASWEDLAAACHDRGWTLRFHTPAAFRHGQRTTPLPKPESVLHSLADQWTHWTGAQVDRTCFAEVWVSDLNLSNRVLRLRGQTYSGAIGTITYRADSRHARSQVGPLFRLAPFTGVGSKTTWGLGRTSLQDVMTSTRQSSRPGTGPT